ncbi:2'-5' RNA ligase family protein [Aristaeella hokkaidonensis]|uniref:2'-5' RNA ligase family protein n=1 Tax=Aristaeella hokkaidonensis TaxID=3046382 RepID=A0AC61MYX9_9FIRM|nr:2'-5' RNA ligase family protein [Aristaeella hokkaidonensis]QUC68395.1 2'-5' RNA ligase family protein [Aristaeella hokkaidonensis]SNT95087.1 2'-5' RNA ligase superfamily protein [Aristaeella hokkaidonensis]
MLCVIAKLSPDVNDKLSRLRETAMPQVRFSSPLYAHITLATYLPEDTEVFITACRKMLRDAHSFSVRYEKLEVLSETSILVAVPASSEPLSSLHNRIEMAFGEHLDRWTRGETWYPHTTLLCDPAADLNTLCNEIRKHFAPFEAHIEQIEFSRVEENGYNIVETVRLL